MDDDRRDPQRWPSIPVAGWQDTRDTLHLYTQVVGKIRLANEPLRQPLVEHHPVRHRHRPHHVADATPDRFGVPDRLRLLRPSARHLHRRRRPPVTAARGPLGGRLPPGGDGDARRPRARHDDLAGAGRDPRRDRVHRRPHPRQLRPRRRAPVLARAGRDAAGVQRVPGPVRRQGQPGAPVLGCTRSRLHPLLRAAGARRIRAAHRTAGRT